MVSEATIDRLIYYGYNQRLDAIVGSDACSKILDLVQSLGK